MAALIICEGSITKSKIIFCPHIFKQGQINAGFSSLFTCCHYIHVDLYSSYDGAVLHNHLMKPSPSPGNTIHPLCMQSVGDATRETELKWGETSWTSTLRWELQKPVGGAWGRVCVSTSISLRCRVLLKLFDVDRCISDEQVYNGVSDLITNRIITLQQDHYRTSFLSSRSKKWKKGLFFGELNSDDEMVC